MSPSWSRAHDWKSCNRQKRFESSNLSISAKKRVQSQRGCALFSLNEMERFVVGAEVNDRPGDGQSRE